MADTARPKLTGELRPTALYLAIGLLLAALVPRAWASADIRDQGVRVGVRNFWAYNGSQSRTRPLRELNRVGAGFEYRGWATLVLGGLAGLAFAAAERVLRRRRRLAIRLALAAPAVASMVATLVFTSRLREFGYLELGWAPYVCLLGALLGATAIVAPQRAAAVD